MNKDPREIIIRPIITERAFDQIEKENRYTFEVAKTANKIEVAKAIQAIFNVTVVKVNTVNVKPKPKPAGKKGFICTICGYIFEGDELPPDFVCPLCKHPASDFRPLRLARLDDAQRPRAVR